MRGEGLDLNVICAFFECGEGSRGASFLVSLDMGL
jgi:hypothetical protein